MGKLFINKIQIFISDTNCRSLHGEIKIYFSDGVTTKDSTNKCMDFKKVDKNYKDDICIITLDVNNVIKIYLILKIMHKGTRYHRHQVITTDSDGKFLNSDFEDYLVGVKLIGDTVNCGN